MIKFTLKKRPKIAAVAEEVFLVHMLLVDMSPKAVSLNHANMTEINAGSVISRSFNFNIFSLIQFCYWKIHIGLIEIFLVEDFRFYQWRAFIFLINELVEL